MDKNNISILIFYDEFGWAWWHRANQIKKHISHSFNIDIIKIGEEFNHNNYDLILLFEYYLYTYVQHVPCEKLIIGCSCPKTIKLACNLLIEKKCAAGIVNNNSVFQYAKNLYKFYNCPNGVDTHIFFPPKTIPKQLTACWVGNSKSMGNKGLDIIREACELSKVPLLAIDQHQNISKGNILSHIELRDTVYHKSSFYICASEYEGTPNPALEALSCGLPVITTRVGNMPEIISNGYNGYFIERSVQGICEGINKIINSDITSLRTGARESVLKSWTWNIKAINYANAFIDIISLKNKQNVKKDDPLVSIIIPTFNRPEDLCNAIYSVLNQTYKNFEIIIINDNGCDVSKIIKTFKDGRIKYYQHVTNKGLAATRNTGINQSKGKYIAYLDDDDEYYPNHIETLVRLLESSQSKIAYTDADKCIYELKNGNIYLKKKFVEHSEDFDQTRLLFQNYIPVLCLMHEKSCLNEVGLFDETMRVHEDWDLWIRLTYQHNFEHIKKTTCSYKIIYNANKNLTTTKRIDFIKTMQSIYLKNKTISSKIKNLLSIQKKCLKNLTLSTIDVQESSVFIDDDYRIYIDNNQIIF